MDDTSNDAQHALVDGEKRHIMICDRPVERSILMPNPNLHPLIRTALSACAGSKAKLYRSTVDRMLDESQTKHSLVPVVPNTPQIPR